ncbi:MAG: hypothetical protein QF371_05550 [Flavobacteriales bacterium]|nr:hypothetical protein [Flavobacteriales bacterium]
MLSTLSTTAQWDSKVTSGVVYLQQQEYEKAISYFKEALEHESELKEKNAVKAYYNLADALIRESKRQVSLQGENTDRKYAEYMFEATDALIHARALPDEEGRFKKQIDIRVNTVFNSLLMSVVQLTNSASSVSEIEKDKYLNEIIRICSSMILLKPDHYLGFDYRGQTQLSLSDTAKAHADLLTAIQHYEKSAPNGPDAMAGYMYYRAAIIELYGYRNNKKALELLRTGIEKNHSDRILVESSDKYSGEDKRTTLGKFYDTSRDLKLFKLDLYLNSSGLTASEMKEFEEGVNEFPKNINVQLAYAQLIQDEEPDKAILIYDKVLAAEPENTTALFNAGVVFYNRAANLSKKLLAEANPSAEEQEQMNSWFRQAIPYFEKAYSLGEANSKKVLYTIANFLGEAELLQKYQ